MKDTSDRKDGRTLGAVCLAAFTLMMYGGIRSPDSEIVFRAGESSRCGTASP